MGGAAPQFTAGSGRAFHRQMRIQSHPVDELQLVRVAKQSIANLAGDIGVTDTGENTWAAFDSRLLRHLLNKSGLSEPDAGIPGPAVKHATGESMERTD